MSESDQRGNILRNREGSRMPRVIRALRYRNYRLFFGGQLISLVGTWMQQVAVTWLVYRLSGSAFLLGLAGFASQIPMFILSPFAGVIADRFNRHRIIVLTQSLAMVQAFILAILTYTGVISVWHIILLMIFLGCINAFDMPTRQSFVLEMVENKEDLGNAIALNSSMFNGARLVGPAVAGIMIATVGESVCFFLNAISFIAVIIALLAMRLPSRTNHKPAGGVFREFREGFRYVYNFRPIRYILSLLVVVSLVGFPFTVLMPVFAGDILHGGPNTLGFLLGAHGVGALIGTISLASRRSVRGLSKWIGIAACVFGSGLAAFALSGLPWLSMLLLIFVGFGMMVQMASSNTILQTVADDDKRGRVISFYTLAFAGMTPFGSLLTGSMADAFGVRVTLVIAGVMCVGAAIFYLKYLPVLRKEIRTVYLKIGVIQDVTQEIQSAGEMTATSEG